MHNLTDLDLGKARHQRTKRLSGLVDKLSSQINQIDNFHERLDIFEGNLKYSHEETKKKVRSERNTNWTLKTPVPGPHKCGGKRCTSSVSAFQLASHSERLLEHMYLTHFQIKERANEIIQHINEDEMKLLASLEQQYMGKLDNICSERENLQDCRSKLATLKETADQVLGTEDESNQPFFETTGDLMRELKRATQIQFLNPDDFEKVDPGFELKFPGELPKLGQLAENNLSANFSFICRIPIHLVTKVTNAGFDWPSDAAVMANGDIVVADTENYQLQIIDKDGRAKTCMAVGEVKPAGVAVTAVGTIVVTDILDRCVKIYSDQGQLLHEFDHELFDSPAGVAVNSLGDIIVSDVGNHCITIHNSQGCSTGKLGGFGEKDIEFDNPWFVATNDQNDIIVSDMGNKCVKVFNSQLELVTKIEDADTVMSPAGVGTDLQGNILVCDSGRNVVSMYTPDGNLIDDVLTEDDGVDGPHGIALGQSGQLVLTQCGNKNISQHELRLYQLYE